MSDRIAEIEEQAKVILEWCRQQRLPEEERDILELRERWVNGRKEWIKTTNNPTNLNLFDYRLRKRPRQKTVTVYLHRDGNTVFSCLNPGPNYKLLGQADITYEEENDDTR